MKLSPAYMIGLLERLRDVLIGPPVADGEILSYDAANAAWINRTQAELGIVSFTDEAAQDAIGAALLDTASVDLVYNDVANTISAAVIPAGIDHNLLANLAVGDPHTQYRLEVDDHTHQSAGAQAGKLDHGLALNGLADDDHSAYLLASDAISRAAFAANWADLTDGGETVLHTHAGAANEAFIFFMAA